MRKLWLRLRLYAITFYTFSNNAILFAVNTEYNLHQYWEQYYGNLHNILYFYIPYCILNKLEVLLDIFRNIVVSRTLIKLHD